jgi:hypothetical protein
MGFSQQFFDIRFCKNGARKKKEKASPRSGFVQPGYEGHWLLTPLHHLAP